MGFFKKIFKKPKSSSEHSGGRDSGSRDAGGGDAAWDRAEWYYDGEDVEFEAASRHIYFVLEWLDSQDLLNDQGRAWLLDREDLDVGLYREDVTPEAARFLDRHYKEWFEEQGIVNFQIDPELEFDGDEGLGEIWTEFQKSG
ncbi:MAG: hypothetical protein ABI333_09160 [bacterium]